MFKLLLVALFTLTANGQETRRSEFQSMDKLLEKAIDQNLLLRAQKSRVEVEDSLATSKMALDKPMVGVSELDRGNVTTYGVVSQKVRFPTKYFLASNVHKHKRESEKASLKGKKLLIRHKLIGLYYRIHSVQKRIQLTKANVQAVREVSSTLR